MSIAVQLDKPDVGVLQNQLYDEITIPPSGHNLDPGKFVLGFTSERITLPPHLAGWVEGRSTLARFGLTVHSTAPTVHPNWDGHLMLEMSVLGEWTCVLKPGLSIAQLRLARVEQPNTATLQSVWQGQSPTA